MKMTRLAEMQYTCLLIFCCFTFVRSNGRDRDHFPSCEVDIMVRRGTTWRAAPGEHVTVRCPVKHCGESVNVAWCKLLDTDKCELINVRENVEIRRDDNYAKDEIISYLTFKRISIDDNGLYRCDLKGYESESISHTINISVSDLYQGVKEIENIADFEFPENVTDENVYWLPYFSLCVRIALLVTTLAVLTLLIRDTRNAHSRDTGPSQGARSFHSSANPISE